MSYIVQNQPYFETGYTDENYVGVAEDFLYFELGYIGNLHQGSATISIQSTTSAVAQERDYASGTIAIAASVSTAGIRIRPGSSTLSVSSGFNAAGDRSRTSSNTAAIASTVDGSADRIRTSSTELTGVFSPSVLAAARKVGEINFNGAFGISAVADRTRSSGATLREAGDETAWNDAGTWLEPTQGTWAKRVRVRGGVYYVNNPATINITSSLSADPFKISGALDIVVEGVGSLSADGYKRSPGSATIDIVSSVDPIPSATLTVGSATLSGVATLSSNAYSKFKGRASISGSSSVSAVGYRTQNSSGILNISSDATVDGDRIARTSAEILAAATVLSTSIRYQRGTVINAAESSVSVVATRIQPGSSSQTISSDIFINGGKKLGIANEYFDIVSSLTAAGRFINIDPYRTIGVEPESRTRKTLSETRIIPVDLESRVNSISSETRIIRVPAENRSWLIDIGTISVSSTDILKKERA